MPISGKPEIGAISPTRVKRSEASVDTLRAPETLTTTRLALRPIGAADTSSIFTYASDPDATRFMNWPCHRALAESETFARRCVTCWQDGSAFPWALVLRESGDVVGAIELRTRPPKADFGYILRRAFWRQGFASEAASAVVAWAMAQPAIYRVWATCHPDNIASARVLEKAGLRPEGRLARWEPRPNLGGAAGGSLVYAVTRPPV
jgi:RimJ/RimL family protein N-acetyltransferase